MQLANRFRRAWNVFKNKDPTAYYDVGPSYGSRPERTRYRRGGERSIAISVYNRIAIDAASVDIRHVRLDKNGRFTDTINSGLNDCLSISANMDQTGRAFIQDAVMSMMDEGYVALVPVEVDTDDEPKNAGAFDVLELRTGKITEWYPRHVCVELYNEYSGKHEELVLPKETTAICENPFYAVMNEPNSTMQRLIRKLSLLDIVDEKTSSGRLDLIIQLPYVVRSEARQKQAERRRRDIEAQLAEGKYGIAYTDGTERVTQLNRPVENNLMKQIEYLTNMFYSQLGLDTSILNGTADADTKLNYFNRIVEPFLSTIVEEMRRKFLTKTARSQHQDIRYFNDPFKLIPVDKLAEIADKLTRNEIMTSNEFRQVIGMKPSEDPNADVLRNKNLSASAEAAHSSPTSDAPTESNSDKEDSQNG